MAHDEFEIEPVRGLPERLPEGERILWQGAPRTWDLARAAMSVHWVIGYFAVLAAWRGLAVGMELGPAAGFGAASFYAALGAAAVAIILLCALVMARTTVYTITSERVVMRIGAALTVTLNLPFRWIDRADLALARNGTGSIHLSLKGDTRISYLVCWPHVRPWKIARTQPTLRAIPDARRVAGILGAAASARVTEIDASLGPLPEALAAE